MNNQSDPNEIQLKQILGKGGEGVVYLGELNGDQVAVKYQRDLSDTEKQLYREIKKSQQLGQIQNIVGIKSISLIDDPKVYEIVMELGGQNLHQYLQSIVLQDYTLKQKDELFLQAIQGVKELHQKKYFHRDIKPENFVLGKSENETLKLMLIDLGLAKKFLSLIQTTYTLDIGSPYYMSPEVSQTRHYNQKVDVWALGLIYYEILTSQTFFDGKNINEIKQNISNITQEEINEKIMKEIQDKDRQELLKQTIQIKTEDRFTVFELETRLLSLQSQKLNQEQNNQKVETRLLSLEGQKQNQEQNNQNLSQIDQLESNEINQTNNQVQNNSSSENNEKKEPENFNQQKYQEIEQNNNSVKSLRPGLNQSNQQEFDLSDQENNRCDNEQILNPLDQSTDQLSKSKLASAQNQFQRFNINQYNLSESQLSEQDGKKLDITQLSYQVEETCYSILQSEQCMYSNNEEMVLHLSRYSSNLEIQQQNSNNQSQLQVNNNSYIQAELLNPAQSSQNFSPNQQNNSQSFELEINHQNVQKNNPNPQDQSCQISENKQIRIPSTNQQNNMKQFIVKNGFFNPNIQTNNAKLVQKFPSESINEQFLKFSPNRNIEPQLQISNQEVIEYYCFYNSTQMIIEQLIYFQQFLIEMKLGKIYIQNLSQIMQKYYKQFLKIKMSDYQLLPQHSFQFYLKMKFDHLVKETKNLLIELKFGKITIQNLQQTFEAFCQYFQNANLYHEISFLKFLSQNFYPFTIHQFEEASNFLFELKFGKIVLQNLQQIIEEFYKKLQLMKTLTQQTMENRYIQDYLRIFQNQLLQNEIFCSELKKAQIVLQNQFQIIDKNHQLFQYLSIQYQFFRIKSILINQIYQIMFKIGQISFKNEYQRNSIEPQLIQLHEKNVLQNQESIPQNSDIHNQLNQAQKKIDKKQKKQRNIQKESNEEKKQESAKNEGEIQDILNKNPTTDIQNSTNPVTIDDQTSQKIFSQEVDEEQFQQFIRLILRFDFDYDKISEYIYGGSNLDAQSNSFGIV